MGAIGGIFETILGLTNRPDWRPRSARSEQSRRFLQMLATRLASNSIYDLNQSERPSIPSWILAACHASLATMKNKSRKSAYLWKYFLSKIDRRLHWTNHWLFLLFSQSPRLVDCSTGLCWIEIWRRTSNSRAHIEHLLRKEPDQKMAWDCEGSTLSRCRKRIVYMLLYST